MKNLRLKGYEKKIKIWLYFFLLIVDLKIKLIFKVKLSLIL